MNFFKHLKFGSKLAIGFGTVLLLTAVVSVVTTISIRALLESAHWVDHTHRVIESADHVSEAMIDMETGQRGFLITGEDRYLEPFTAGVSRFDDLIAKGRTLTSDNPAQVKRWDEIYALKKRWISEVAEPEIAARREVAKGAAARERFREVSARTVGKEVFDQMRGVLAQLQTDVAGDLQWQLLLSKVTLDLVNMETGQRGFLLTGLDASLEPYEQGGEAFAEHMMELAVLSATSSIDGNKIARLNDLVKQWRTLAAEPEIEARRDTDRHPKTIDDIASMMKSGNGKLLMDTIRAKLAELIEVEERLIEERIEEQKSMADMAIGSSVLGATLAIAIGILVAIMVSRSVTRPLKKTNAALQLTADGDFTQKLEIDSRDEFGEMAESFNAFSGALRSTINRTADAATQLAAAAEEMATTTSQTSSGVNNQKLETEQVANAVTEMASSVADVSNSASAASDAAQKADGEARTGNQVVSDTVSAIQNLSAEVERSTDTIEALKRDSERIGVVLDVIKGIAEQTNLLALNAAIEAARAGEQGRGFAVVADEVRTLAQRTQESTTEIEALIETLQSGAEQSASAMEASRDMAATTVEQARHAGESLDSITQAVAVIVDMNAQIATASEQQNAVAQEIERSVLSIKQVAEETSVGVEQTSSASQDLAKLSNDLYQLIGVFKT